MDLRVEWRVGDDEWEFLRLLGEGIETGRLGFLRKVEIDLGAQYLHNVFLYRNDSGFLEAKRTFLTALGGVGRLCVLSELRLRGFHLTEVDVGLIAEALKGGCLSRLRVFQLTKNNAFGRESLETLMSAVVENEGGMPFLEELVLKDTMVGGGVGPLCMALMHGKLPRLAKMDFRNSELIDEGLRGLAEAVRGGWLTGMISLLLSANRRVSVVAWGEFLQAITDSQKGLPKLKFLELSDTHAHRAGAGGRLAAVLRSGKLPSLQSLYPEHSVLKHRLCLVNVQEELGLIAEDVRRVRLPPRLESVCYSFPFPRGLRNGDLNLDALISAIAESERGLPSCVTGLRLWGGRVGEEALASLAASRGVFSEGKLSNLKELDLSACEIDDKKLKRLAEVFTAHGCPKLTHLNLSRNRISIDGFSAFLDILRPGCLPNLFSLVLFQQEQEEGHLQRRELDLDASEALKDRARSEKKIPNWTNIDPFA
uniref:Uncharacterized protein n=1 Tax=Chromera velia CCMP2878 TaxID=1169474 RepID=A0A0G4GQW0_9ALVE|eukprot:Cvel_22972.t1-p1 / transcript=Cvel_22972.t1 / gene=Cvel_22972 / organism=Chromera_velia_CCMP2878 / gene_product=hypothetical protein / transcript_product=hypothetical protein / location=Cvel_scaffold2315:21683-23122(-) / protein_length=480 / sequence_SO=supercontig / SO=protein_coding / is_pseudo=false